MGLLGAGSSSQPFGCIPVTADVFAKFLWIEAFHSGLSLLLRQSTSFTTESPDIVPRLGFDLACSHLLHPPQDLVPPFTTELGLHRCVEALEKGLSNFPPEAERKSEGCARIPARHRT